MKEMTDRELTDKISQVFENFEDPDAAHGWQELRKKYPENNIKPLIFWWSAAAAVLLLVGGLWFTIPYYTQSPKEITNKTNPKPEENISTDKPLENTLNNDVEGRKTQGRTENPVYATDTDSSKRAKDESLNLSRSTRLSKATIFDSGNPINPARLAAINSARVQHSNIQSSAQQIPPRPLSDGVRALTTTNVRGINRDSLIDLTAKMLALSQRNSESDDHLHEVENIPYSSKKISAQKKTFSFYAGSFFNYSLGSETELNFGAGFTSDIKLTSNLKLSTGLALANNSLRYNDGVPASGNQKLAFDAFPSFGGTSGSAKNNLTTITRYDARLLALDIPINLKYLIIPKDNKLYLLAGLSSGTYLDETYSLDYQNYSAAGFYVNQSQAVKARKPLQTFDIARTLNISFGYSSNVGKTQNITIEPFLKYPLGGLGSEDLKFGSAGINLKMNFSQKKQR